jgi:hypothetical protein
VGGPQDLLAARALVAEVVDRVTHLLVAQGGRVLLAQKHWDEGRLPVVAVDDVGPLVRLDHELQGGLGERAEPLDVVPVPVQPIAAEEALRRVWLDEVALSAVHEPEPDGARYVPAVPGHAQSLEADVKAPHVPVAHASVLR